MKYLSTSIAVFISLALSTTINAQSRQIGNFTGISASTSVSVKLIKADEPRIEFKMIKGHESSLITKVKGDDLIIKIHTKKGRGNNTQAKVIVYYTELDDISVSAGATVKCDNPIKTKSIDIDVSSGSIADLEIITDDIDADASSGATLKLEGNSLKGEFDASSGSTINASRLICDFVDADVSSGASIKVHVNKKLNADASSGGSIRYKGDADDTKIDKGWSGQISRM